MKNINVFGYATFGTPNGFTQSCIHGNQSLEKVLKKFDLKSDAIQLLSPNDRIYSIRKESVQNNAVVSYSVYTFAKEKNSNRSGTFIGTSLVFTNEILPENLILSSLHEIHINLKNNNVSGDNFVLNISHSKDFNLQNIFSKDFEKLEHQTNKVSFLDWDNSGYSLVIKTDKLDVNSIQNLFKKSIQILPKYETIYFIDSKEIAEFVSQKKLFRLIDNNGLDREIEKLQEERVQKTADAILSFKNKRQKHEEEGRKEFDSLKKKIEQNEQKHSENSKTIEEADRNLKALNNLYQVFLRKSDELITKLSSEKELGDINYSFNQLEREFIKEKNKLNSTNEISSFSNNRTVPSRPTSRFIHEDEEEPKERKLDVFKIISVVLNVLLIGGAIVFYTMFYEKPQEQIPINIPENKEDITLETTILDSVSDKLNPMPNAIAENQENIAEMLKKFDSTSKINYVVEVIFEKNKSIKDIYQNQKGNYTKALFEKNTNAFKINNSDTILMNKNLLLQIPTYKN
ncbi:hypothetical protein OF897_05425 [Chryseobacterium formosus]|uniref:LysM domain-containing protein n=1 Tax=Chryseobacterium formosus TaxID=1537363 RepID=A0ABT3XMK9_9FLAO|nr:hypothetical protein [Chryseobacterium formosus]MCX8523355.1 hypothetical protein [Chryseobacterium formosus]